MNTNFEKIKTYLLELNHNIIIENKEEGMFIIDNEEKGVKNLIIGCSEPIVIIEQFLFEIKKYNIESLKFLLEKNRTIIHGALTLDNSGKGVIFRDTLQVENLDLNELEASINSLSLLLSEYYNDFINLSK